jgi:hypothetical protein
MMGLADTVTDLKRRLDEPHQYSALGRLTRGILQEARIDSSLALPADEFNRAAERYYRDHLRIKHIQEGFRFLEEDLRRMVFCKAEGGEVIRSLLGDQTLSDFLAAGRAQLVRRKASTDYLPTLIDLLLTSIHHNIKQSEMTSIRDPFEENPSPIYRAG